MKVSIKKPKNSSLNLKHRAFVMLGMMRSGSNLLERTLGLLPDVRCHGELFNPGFVGLDTQFNGGWAGFTRENLQARDDDELGFLKKLDAACDRQIMGLRLFLDHSGPMTARLLYDPAVKKIVLSRNMLESYVSLGMAQETGVWLSTEEAKAPPKPVTIDVGKLINYALRQSLYYNDILSVLHQTGQAFEMVDYAEVKDLARQVEIAAFIGSAHRPQKVEEPIKRQNPGTLEDKIANFAFVQKELRRRQMLRWFV